MSQLESALSAAIASNGQSVLAMSQQSPVLVVFLRHFGCTFCREALADLAAKRAEIELPSAPKAPSIRLLLVHMVDQAQGQAVLAKYGLGDVAHVSDPGKALYRALGLARGSLWQLFGIKSFVRGLYAGVLGGHWVGKLAGDGFQMPGVFLIHNGQVLRGFVHKTAADRPDDPALSACPIA